MDIQRGSRRARHVAANTAASQASQAQQQQQQQHPPPTQDDGLRRGILRHAPQTRDMHRTPDQRQAESDDEHQMPTVAPRVNPFRLHRWNKSSTAFYPPKVLSTRSPFLVPSIICFLLCPRCQRSRCTMPRVHLEPIPITRGSALLRRSSSPPVSPRPETNAENHDAVANRMGREANVVVRNARHFSERLSERSAAWRSRFGSMRRRQQRSTAPPPEDEFDVSVYMDVDMDDTDMEIADTEADDSHDAATRGTTTPRLSMPLGSDDASDSDPDLSVLAMARGGGRFGGPPAATNANTLEEQMLLQQQAEAMAYEDEVMSQEQYEAEETSIEEQVEEEGEEDQEEEPEVLVDPASIGLKEISNLGKFTVSSHKPGNGVQELRSDDLKLYWQSDGPQPHKLTIYFVKRVGIRVIRFFVDFQEDESYTPTKIVFKSGTSENNMIEFATMTMDNPYGWQDVPISGAGGEPDGNTLVSYVLQMQILENHQNGKDTHLRGIKIYAFDPDSGQQAGGRRQNAEGVAEEVAEMVASGRQATTTTDRLGSTSGDRLSDMARILASSRVHAGEGAFSAADFLREPELR
ncbi:hypothetical protein PWT90_10233 [Aphanocladium album]|nr:hypothetical protein PWT90_10233 [Aphanocladium album]